MATLATTIWYDWSTTANIRSFGSGFESALTGTCGLTRTSDTGQIVWSTQVGQSNFSTTNLGYAIFQFNDTLQATAPFYMKLEFINNNSLLTAPSIAVSFGTGTSGAGALTGNLSTRFVMGSAKAANNTASQNCFFSGAGGSSGNRVQFDMFDGPNINECWVLSVERSKDNTGADNSDGLIVMAAANGIQNTGQNTEVQNSLCFLLPSVATTTSIATPQYCWPGAYNMNGSQANAGNVGIVVPVPFNFIPYNSGIGAMAYQGTDVAQGSTISVTSYGSAHTYYAPTQQNAGSNPWPLYLIAASDGYSNTSSSGSVANRIIARPLIRFE